MPRILIVDDHAVVREGLTKILADSHGGFQVDEAGHGQEALALVLRERFDLVLLDISMPGRSGLDVLKEMKSHRPLLPVLMLSMHSEKEYVLRALGAGASGYVTKDSAAEELLGAIREVLSGGQYISASFVENQA